MRHLLILPMMVLSACIGISVRVPVGGSKGPPEVGVRAGAGPWGVVILGIRTHLKNLRNEIPGLRAQLHPIPCGTETCYSADEVRDAIAKIRRDARAAFPDVALASRLTLDAELALVANHPAAFQRTSSIQLVRNAPDNSVHLVRAQEVDATFERAQEPIDIFLAHRELNPTLHIRSEPDRAKFEMLIGTNRKTLRDASTQDELESVWRGRYTGTIRKKGYREVAGFTIDLFHQRGTTIRCVLVRNTAPQNDESTCRLEN
ncbi:MAG: hypothetical protein QOE68_310 [Thermoanaerobaculia bacterium]|jgi:hypothetical protein|nr:hypothetical protein [Thermoanaerobaculia bacterium]